MSPDPPCHNHCCTFGHVWDLTPRGLTFPVQRGLTGPLHPRNRDGSEALSDIAKHSPELAQVVVDAGACVLLVKARRVRRWRITSRRRRQKAAANWGGERGGGRSNFDGSVGGPLPMKAGRNSRGFHPTVFWDTPCVHWPLNDRYI